MNSRLAWVLERTIATGISRKECDMKKYRIVIADAGRALVFAKVAGNSAATLVHDLENPTARVKASKLTTDEPGWITKGHGKSAMDAHGDPHEREAAGFAWTLSQLLETSAINQEFDSLVLFAPGHFLGLLHSRLGGKASRRLSMVQANDLTHASIADLQNQFSEWV
jgi:protein required for attachment to host cells